MGPYVPFGTLWLFLAAYISLRVYNGSIWLHMASYGYLYLLVAPYGYIWLIMAPNDSPSLPMAPYISL